MQKPRYSIVLNKLIWVNLSPWRHNEANTSSICSLSLALCSANAWNVNFLTSWWWKFDPYMLVWHITLPMLLFILIEAPELYYHKECSLWILSLFCSFLASFGIKYDIILVMQIMLASDVLQNILRVTCIFLVYTQFFRWACIPKNYEWRVGYSWQYSIRNGCIAILHHIIENTVAG